jgi:hypothetical protein
LTALSPAAGSSRSSLLQGERRSNEILYAACNILDIIDIASIFQLT